MKISIDTAAGGALMVERINEAKQMLKSNYYHWKSE